MFDFSFGELLVVGLVALVVLGPERLPKAARFTGLWVRRARAQWYSVKSELEHELASDELRRSLQDGREALREAGDQLRDIRSDLEHDHHDDHVERKADEQLRDIRGDLEHDANDVRAEPVDHDQRAATMQPGDRNV